MVLFKIVVFLKVQQNYMLYLVAWWQCFKHIYGHNLNNWIQMQ